MKKFLVLENSFSNEVDFNLLMTSIPYLKDYDFYLFKDLNILAKMCGKYVYSNYQKFLQKLNNENINYYILKEYDLNEYLFNNKYSSHRVYLSPTPTSVIVASKALLNFSGEILILERIHSTLKQAKFTNISGLEIPFLKTSSLGKKSFDFDSIKNYFNTKINYNFNGKNYDEVIPNIKTDCGNEAITFVSKINKQLRVKLYTRPLLKYEIDKLSGMIKLSKNINTNIGMAKGLVYNEKKVPVGIYENNFSNCNTLQLERLKDYSENISKDILEQMIILQTFSIYHRDLHHNILVDEIAEKAHIIDTDSTQFRDYPAIASSGVTISNIPHRYYTDSLIYNKIDLSYTALAIQLYHFTDPFTLFENYDKDGNVIINKSYLNQLKKSNKELANLIEDAYIKFMPISLLRIYKALYSESNETKNSQKNDTKIYISKNKRKFDFDNEEESNFENREKKQKVEKTHQTESNNKKNNKQLSKFQLFLLNYFEKDSGTRLAYDTNQLRWERFLRKRLYQKQLIRLLIQTIAIIVIICLILFY